MRDFTPPMARPYKDIHEERIRAHAKWGGPGGRPGASVERGSWRSAAWLPVLVEEVGEVARVLCEVRHGHLSVTEARMALRTELVQVCAMGAAWVDAIDQEAP